MKKILQIVIMAALVILVAGVSFLYFRSSDYRARFTVKTTPDVAYFHILNWDIWNRKHSSCIAVSEKDPVNSISHLLSLKDTTLLFQWEFMQISESETVVRVFVSDPDRKFYNRLTVPFLNTPFEMSVRSNLLDINRRMNHMLETFRYEFTGPARFEETECACVSFTGTAREKARSMISHVVELNQFVKQNNLDLSSNPFILVHHWDETTDTLDFEFCFPVSHSETFPDHPAIRLRTIGGMDAVKTDFYGNYSISDIAWHNLAEEANKLGFRTNHTLIEVYHNDPHSGGNELEWKAEIFLGIEPG